MKSTGFLLTLGLGMAAGAVACSMLPNQSSMKKAVNSAAESTKHAARKAMDSAGM